MKKKATLLITNLEKIYTMQTIKQKDVIYSHAYLAMHHDVILEIGEGSYTHLLDKDTRILEGRSHFAIPAFIETDAVYPACDEWNKTRKLQEYRMQYMQHGVLTMAMDSHAQSFLEMDIVPKQALTYPILYGNAIIKASTKYTKKRFCISTRDNHFITQDPLLLAQLLHIKQGMDALLLLKALTCYPAKALQLPHVGVLKKGKQADILICHGNSLSHLFQGLYENHITQIVKKGVRIYPNLLI